MTSLLASLFFWTCVQMGVNPDKTSKPIFQPINVVQMKVLKCGVKMPLKDCDLLPAEYVPGKIYYIGELDYQNSRELSSFIVHQIVHHIQYTQHKLKNPNFESDARKIQELYLESVEI